MKYGIENNKYIFITLNGGSGMVLDVCISTHVHIDRIPGPVCLRVKFSSLNGSPEIDFAPVPWR